MADHAFGCPRCSSTDIEEINEVIAYYPVTRWNENGEPAWYGEPAYGNSFRVDEDPYICQTCRISGRECSFSEPAPLPGDPTMS